MTDFKHVLEELDSNELKEKFEITFKNRFQELENKLNNSQDISVIRGILDESYLLSNKCIRKLMNLKM